MVFLVVSVGAQPGNGREGVVQGNSPFYTYCIGERYILYYELELPKHLRIYQSASQIGWRLLEHVNGIAELLPQKKTFWPLNGQLCIKHDQRLVVPWYHTRGLCSLGSEHRGVGLVLRVSDRGAYFFRRRTITRTGDTVDRRLRCVFSQLIWRRLCTWDRPAHI